MHCQQVDYIMKEYTSVLLQITTLHHEQKLAPFRLPYDTMTSALPKETLHRKGDLTHVIFPYSTCTSALSKTTLHCESNLTHASIHYITSAP